MRIVTNHIFRKKWWDEPELPRRTIKEHRRDPKHPLLPESRVGRFNPSKLWVPYRELETFNGSGLFPLLSLETIAKRYGLSKPSRVYWRKHILPEPTRVTVKRGGMTGVHWTLIQVRVLDIILRHLESKGRLNFTARYEDVIDLYLHGCDVMTDHYVRKYEQKETTEYDERGVHFIQE